MARQVAQFGTLAIGNSKAIAGRLMEARQRAAGLLRASLISCERDAAGRRGLPQTDAVCWEVAQLEAALAVLCQGRPAATESKEELLHRRDAEVFFEAQLGEAPQRRMLKEHMELAR